MQQSAELLRMTIVFAREDGNWKLVQQHISIGVPNRDVVGQNLTVSEGVGAQ